MYKSLPGHPMKTRLNGFNKEKQLYPWRKTSVCPWDDYCHNSYEQRRQIGSQKNHLSTVEVRLDVPYGYPCKRERHHAVTWKHCSKYRTLMKADTIAENTREAATVTAVGFLTDVRSVFGSSYKQQRFWNCPNNEKTQNHTSCCPPVDTSQMWSGR